MQRQLFQLVKEDTWLCFHHQLLSKLYKNFPAIFQDKPFNEKYLYCMLFVFFLHNPKSLTHKAQMQ